MLTLAHLASQHHHSAYSRLKFGLHGAPVPYAPLSVLLPDHHAHLLLRQLNSPGPAWFRSCPPPAPDLHFQLNAALAEPLPSVPRLPLKTSATHPINISSIISPHLVPLISSHLMPASAPHTLFEIPPSFALDRLSLASHCHTPPPAPPPPVLGHIRTRSSVADALDAALNSCFSLDDSLPTPSPPRPPPPFLIGNMFLSSCPGKKVRLQGPVKGRSGVCRDLTMDLRRIKDLGVGCVVCCLDDTELDFLGSPWPEYQASAHSMGIDVLRIPTPEGLAPLTPVSLDIYLTDLINAYTLRAIPVLVHCRGGVGRAGVIACCWIIKLGLCGWVQDDDVPVFLDDLEASICALALEDDVACRGFVHLRPVRRDTVRFVERVIGVVRKRRSIKAIETYEQVRFLVDFVEYLREGPQLLAA